MLKYSSTNTWDWAEVTELAMWGSSDLHPYVNKKWMVPPIKIWYKVRRFFVKMDSLGDGRFKFCFYSMISSCNKKNYWVKEPEKSISNIQQMNKNSILQKFESHFIFISWKNLCSWEAIWVGLICTICCHHRHQLLPAINIHKNHSVPINCQNGLLCETVLKVR